MSFSLIVFLLFFIGVPIVTFFMCLFERLTSSKWFTGDDFNTRQSDEEDEDEGFPGLW